MFAAMLVMCITANPLDCRDVEAFETMEQCVEARGFLLQRKPNLARAYTLRCDLRDLDRMRGKS